MSLDPTWKTRARLLQAALLLLGLLASRPGTTQGMFYAEEVGKDGRLYVFNNMKQYDDWKQSGEVGVAITRIGVGPRGETVVFDSEDAIHLYNFKNGRPPEVFKKAPEKKPVMKFDWKDGKTTFETDKAKLVLSNRVQVRFTSENPQEGDTINSFRIRRAKTKFDGWFYTKRLEYELQANWPAASTALLEDANINFDFTSENTRAIMIKAGSFKVPQGRQELTSSGNQQFVDRSQVANEFERGRDIGLQFWGQTRNTVLEWRFMVNNGAGIGNAISRNDNDEMGYNGRVMFQPFGDVKYSESDFDSAGKALFAIAGSFDINDRRTGAEGSTATKRDVYGIDGALKFAGLFVTGEWFTRKNETEPDAETGVVDEFDSEGWYLQGGFLVVPQKLEIAGRYGSLRLTTEVDDNARKEYGIAVGWYFNKHNLKLQGDWRRLENQATDVKNNEVRVQTQFIF